jgi:hypothetical protein
LTTTKDRPIVCNLNQRISLFYCRLDQPMKNSCRLKISHDSTTWMVFAIMGLVCLACGPIDTGAMSMTQVLKVPDPVVFAQQLQPLLEQGCASPACHGRNTSFQIRPASQPYWPSGDLIHPSQLPEPFLSNYFTVLAYSDLDVPEKSLFLVWGLGAVPSHVGGKALSASDANQLLQWLKGSGGGP